jgi:hypothetical protein
MPADFKIVVVVVVVVVVVIVIVIEYSHDSDNDHDNDNDNDKTVQKSRRFSSLSGRSAIEPKRPELEPKRPQCRVATRYHLEIGIIYCPSASSAH